MKKPIQVYLRDQNELLVKEWQEIFKDEENVHVSHGDIFAPGEHLNVDAIVSPANSFGFMDGGIDFIYSEYFGWGIGDLLRNQLWQKYCGELLVGQAELIDMRKTNPCSTLARERINQISFLICAPTMRVPSDVSKTVNAYLAFTATLRTAVVYNIKSILCPGLGTAVGRMPPETCACQMYEAYKHYLKPRFHDVLSNAHRLHYSMLNSDTYIGSEWIAKDIPTVTKELEIEEV